MRTLYLDCGMGAAGDMLTAALLELLPDPDAFLAELNALGIPGVQVRREPSVKCGITGTHVTVTVDGRDFNLQKAFTFEGGKRHRFTVVLNKTSNGINVTIDQWEDDGIDHGGTAE